MAAFEQTHGEPRGSAQDYKEQQAKIQDDRRQEEIASKKAKAKWLSELSELLRAGKNTEFEAALVRLDKSSSLDSPFIVQIKLALLNQAVFEQYDVIAVIALEKHRVGCNISRNNGLLDKAIELPSFEPLRTVVDAGCAKGRSRERNQLVDTIVASSDPKRQSMLSAIGSDASLKSSVLKKLVEQGEQAAMLSYISNGTLRRNILIGRDNLLEYAINSDDSKFASQLLESGVSTTVETNGRTRYALLAAYRKENIDLFNKILRVNPEQLNDEELIEDLFRPGSPRDRNFTFNKRVIKALVDNGLKISELTFKTSKLLRQAILEGDHDHVVYLLDAGVSPNQEALGLETVLKMAMQQRSPDSEKIVQTLRDRGALEDILDIIAKKRGVSRSTSCALGKLTVDQGVFKQAYVEYGQKNRSTVTTTPFDWCVIGLKRCINDGNGSDDCFQSMPACSPSKSTACCTQQIKDQYVEARCSGFNVQEAMYYLGEALD